MQPQQKLADQPESPGQNGLLLWAPGFGTALQVGCSWQLQRQLHHDSAQTQLQLSIVQHLLHAAVDKSVPGSADPLPP